LAVLLTGSTFGSAGAGPLPIKGVEEFQSTLIRDRSASADDASAASALVERRRELREAARRLPSLGEVTRALLLPDWGSADFEEFDTPVPLDKIEAAVQQPNDADFKREVQNLMKMGGEDSSRVVTAVSAQIKRDVRLQLLDRLEQRIHFYLRNGRPADRIAAANLVSDTMGNARRQDNQAMTPDERFQQSGGKGGNAGERRGSATNALFLRQRMRELAGDLQKLSRDADAPVQVASVRALSNLEGDPVATVSTLRPLLTSGRTSLTTRRATAAALANMVDIIYLHIQTDKSRPLPPLRSLAQIFPAAASGLGDADPEVRRSCLAACQEAVTALDELIGDRNTSLESMTVYKPLLQIVEKSLPNLNRGARDAVPELRVASCHLLETLALVMQKVQRMDEAPLPPPQPQPVEPRKGPDKNPSKDVKGPPLSSSHRSRRAASRPSQWAATRLEPQTQTILLTPVPVRPTGGTPVPQTGRTPVPSTESPPAVTLERPVKLPVVRSVSLSRSPASSVQPVAFLARQADELPPPTQLEAGLKETIRAMISGLSDRDYRVRLASADVLETLGDRAVPAIPALVKALGDSNKFVRWSSARTLGQLARRATERNEAKEVVAGLMRLLNDREDLSVRITSVFAIEQYGPAAKEAVPLLARAINRGDKEYIIAVLHALQGIGTDAQPALPNVAWILRSRDLPTSVREEAAQTLGRFGPLAKGQLRDLREVMVTDADEKVRNAASSAVLAIDRPSE
jgi:HEAT repeat protein